VHILTDFNAKNIKEFHSNGAAHTPTSGQKNVNAHISASWIKYKTLKDAYVFQVKTLKNQDHISFYT